jgi:hypothetical protein
LAKFFVPGSPEYLFAPADNSVGHIRTNITFGIIRLREVFIYNSVEVISVTAIQWHDLLLNKVVG